MENIKYDVNQEPIVTSKVTFDILLKQKNPSDLIALYHFYYYTAKWQQTNQVNAKTSYVAKGLNWSQSRVRKNKKILIELGFIEDYRKKDPITKSITGHYIKVNFIWSYPKENPHRENPDVGNPSRGKPTLWETPQYGKGHTMGNVGTNALRGTNKGNALRETNKENTKERTNKRKRLNNIVAPPLEGTTVHDKNKHYLPIAKNLANLITSKKDVKISGQKLNGWANSIRLMVTADGIKPTRIHDALDWYAKHHADEYVPVIESGSSLREKFLRLEAAIERGKSNGKNTKGSGFKGKEQSYQKPKRL